MLRQLRVLIVEDDANDAELIIDALRAAEFDPTWQRVDSEAAFREALVPEVDVVLADFEVPEFNGFEALQVLQATRPEIPFILVSGAIGEERAVMMIKHGAADYLLKDRLARLGAAVHHALEDRKLRRQFSSAEKALIEGDQRFLALFNAASDPIYMIRDGIFFDCNVKGSNTYGRTREQILGHSPVEFAPEFQPDGRNSKEKAAEIIELALAGQPQMFEWTSLHADGSQVHSDVSLNRLEIGGKTCLMAIARDVTERKRSQAQITEQAALLDQARDAIIVRSLDGKILYWNQGAERVYGWSREEVIGKNVLEILHTQKDVFDQLSETVMSRGGWQGQLRHLTKDRREVMIEVNCTLIRDEEGLPKSVLSINTDITAKNKIEEQLMRSQRMESVGALAGGVAHDLNNILAPIMMSISLLKAGPPEDQARRILESIDLSAKRGAGIVKQQLSFARGLEGQRVEVHPEVVVRELESIINDTFPKNIELIISVAPGISPIIGDPTQVHQVLLNLCLNARDAMPDGGVLAIDVENCAFDEKYAATHFDVKAGRYVSIGVTDSGVGIAPEILEKVFDPFFTTKDVTKGTGLGLSTAQSIIKSHDGFINVFSIPGEGTTFKVYLPAQEVAIETCQQSTDDGALPRGNNELILVVDDEVSILAVTSETLEAFGYRTVTANNGIAALEVYQQAGSEIAAVLTDMAMPIMDGTATIRALLQINPNLRVIATSGLTTNESISRAVEAGSRFFLSKPYPAEALLRTLRIALDSRPGNRNGTVLQRA